LRQARKTVGEAVRVKEHSLAGIKRKQQVLDELATPSPKQKSVESSLTGSQTTGSKEVDAAIASFVYENGISFNVADSPSFGRMIDESMKFAKQNPLQSYKTPSRKNYLGSSLTKHISQQSNLWRRFLLSLKNMEQQSHQMDAKTCGGGPF
jgi:hypothetical protein